MRTALFAGAAAAVLAATSTAAAQDHAQHQHPAPAAAAPADPHAAHQTPSTTTDPHAAHDTSGGHEQHGPGMYGPYPMSREASGTSWVPEAGPMEGWHLRRGPWTAMLHGNVDLVHSSQGGPRGDDKTFSASMIMGMARRELGPGVLGLRGMISFDPFMGKQGYPLLFQTGETANGEHLVDRQHPHDFLGELAASYSVPLGERNAAFVYLGYPGEPALGPPAYLHRFSGMFSPEAPLGHHWLDSTHVTFGVATAGLVLDRFKVEGSVFTGREPDEDRWDFDEPRFDSTSVRLSWNPTPEWALQASRGELESPEALEPDTDVTRTTASAIWHRAFGPGNDAQVTLAWGRNEKSDGPTTDAWLLEGAVRLRDRHVLFGRAERTDKDELFAGHHDEGHDEFGHSVFEVGKLSVGYVFETPVAPHVKLGVGGLVSAFDVPGELEPVYGDPGAHMLFLRLRLD